MAKLSLDNINRLSDKKIWLLFFSYVLVVTLLIQLIILPFLLPNWHAGDGLLVGGDWVRFHRYAQENAANVKDLGWDAFTLYPEGQFVAGIASIFYIIFFPIPAVLLPLNAILHATAGLILFKVLSKITEDRFISLVGATLFIIFPSSLRWVSQMHNDSYSILGALMFLYGWVHLESLLVEKKFRTFLISAFYIVFGIFVVALVRVYLVDVYLLASLILGLYLILRTFVSPPLKSAWGGISLVVLLISMQGILGEDVIQPQVRTLRRGQTLFSTIEPSAVLETQSSVENHHAAETQNETSSYDHTRPKRFTWEKTTFLPSRIDEQISELILKRFKATRNWSDGSSGIDTEVDLSSSIKTLLYVPRALQIALFAPFPIDWFEEGTKAPSNFMKRVAAVETSFVYVLFAFLPFGLKRWGRNSTMHLVLIFCIYFLAIFAIATPNVGNLYRFRYPYFSVMVSLGTVSLTSYILNYRK